MALAFFERTSSYTTTGATSYATGTSFTPATNSLMICFVCGSSTETSLTLPTSVSGNGVTYSQHATTNFVSAVSGTSVWAGIAASPSAGVVTASGWALARTGIGMSVLEITGADVSGTALNAIANVVSTTFAAGTSQSVTMTGPLGTGNLNCGFFDHTATESIVAGTNNTLGSTGSYATPARGAGSVFDTGSTYANPAATWTTSAVSRALGVEIKAAAAGGAVVVKQLSALGVG